MASSHKINVILKTNGMVAMPLLILLLRLRSLEEARKSLQRSRIALAHLVQTIAHHLLTESKMLPMVLAL